jgi:hypothetical protein
MHSIALVPQYCTKVAGFTFITFITFITSTHENPLRR